MYEISENDSTIATSFTIEADADDVYIDKLTIYNDFRNSVDYNTNYFAFITKQHIAQITANHIFDNIIQTTRDVSLLNIVRIPVKKYTVDDIIDAINVAYIDSMLNIHERNYTNTSTLSFPINPDGYVIKDILTYKHDNTILPLLNDYQTYNDTSIVGKTIDISTIQKTFIYSTDVYTIKLTNNSEIHLINGDKYVYYNANRPLKNNTYEIHMDVPSNFSNEDELLNNLLFDTQYTFHFVNNNNTYANNFDWFSNNTTQLHNNNTTYLPFTFNQQQTSVQSLSIKNTITNEVLTTLNVIVKNKWTSSRDIFITEEFEDRIDNDDFTIYDTTVIYFKTSQFKLPIKTVECTTEPPINGVRIEKITDTSYRLTKGENTDDQILEFVCIDYYGNTRTVSLTIKFSQEPITRANTLAITPRDVNSSGVVWDVWSEDMKNNFFEKITNNIVTAVIVDLPNIYLCGSDGTNTIMANINMETFMYAVYESPNKITINTTYNITNSDDYFGVLFVKESMYEFARKNTKLITSYENNNITFFDNIRPVNIIDELKHDINTHPFYDYTCYLNNNIIHYENNEMTVNQNIEYNHYRQEQYYSSFGLSKRNVMYYLNIPDETFTMNKDTVVDTPLIYGNYFKQYIMRTNPINNLLTSFKVLTTKQFLKRFSLKVIYTYMNDIDTLINNIRNTQNIYFNILKEVNISNEDNKVVEINKTVKLGNKKIHIFVISDQLKWCIEGKDCVLTYSI